jgi:Putative zinc-finger
VSGPHLGARVSPLVDGRLAADAEARVAEHLLHCSECADAVDAERLVRARVQALGVPPMSADLVSRLLDIGGPSGPLPPRDQPMAVPARPVVGVAPPSRTDATRGRGARRPAPRSAVLRVRRRPVAAALAGTFTLLGAGIVGALVLGGMPGGDAPAPVAELRTTPSASASIAPAARDLTAPGASASPSAPTSAPTASATPTP